MAKIAVVEDNTAVREELCGFIAKYAQESPVCSMHINTSATSSSEAKVANTSPLTLRSGAAPLFSSFLAQHSIL